MEITKKAFGELGEIPLFSKRFLYCIILNL